MSTDRSNFNYYHLLHSAIGTGIAELITLPICTIKTHYQNTNSHSIIHTTKYIHSSYGLGHFWKASFPSISSQIISTSSKYFLYRTLQDTKFISPHTFINGLISGILSSIITHPIDYIKIHLQMSQSMSTICSNLKHQDPHNSTRPVFLKLYRGYSKTFSKVLCSSGFFFPLYDYFKHTTNNTFIASILSSITSTLLMHPIDYLKTRHIYGQSLFSGWNPISYYKGLSLNLMRIVPHFTIVMSSINYLDTIRKSNISNRH